MGEVDLDAAIRARLDADLVAAGARDGGVVAAQTAVEYRRALNAVLMELNRAASSPLCADDVRRVVARELGVTP